MEGIELKEVKTWIDELKMNFSFKIGAQFECSDEKKLSGLPLAPLDNEEYLTDDEMKSGEQNDKGKNKGNTE